MKVRTISRTFQSLKAAEKFAMKSPESMSVFKYSGGGFIVVCDDEATRRIELGDEVVSEFVTV